MLATLFLAQGTPMLLAGDEFGRTQHGNNNAYCQDNEISWLDWSMAGGAEGSALTAFVARLIALRRDHPVLRAPRFLHGQDEPAPGIADIAWFDGLGRTMSAEVVEQSRGADAGVASRRPQRRRQGVDPDACCQRRRTRTATSACRRPACRRALLLDSAAARRARARRSTARTIAVGRAQRRADASRARRMSGHERLRARPAVRRDLIAPDRTRFRLWAPAQETVARRDRGPAPSADDALAPTAGSRPRRACGAGARYRYRLADGLPVPDPASRAQADDVHGPSLVVDPRAYRWRNPDWRGRPWHETVLYELHAGALGGFAGVAGATCPASRRSASPLSS